MPLQFNYRFLFVAMLAGLLLLFPAESRAVGPFDNMRGSWSGGGTITLTNGGQERIRCKAAYNPSGPNLRMSLVCASDSYKVDLASQLAASGGEIKGTWSEATRQVNGDLVGIVTGGNIQVSVKSAIFSASLNVKTSGGNQLISITAPGTEVSRVVIALKR